METVASRPGPTGGGADFEAYLQADLDAFRRPWIEQLDRRAVYRWTAAAGFGLALPVTALGLLALAATGWANFGIRQLGELIIYFVGIPLALGYVALLQLAGSRLAASTPGRALRAVGRMALTHYLLQSVVCTLLF